MPRKSEKPAPEEVLEWLKTHNGKMPRGGIFKNGKAIRIEEMTAEERYEINLYKRWIVTRERKILYEYRGRKIQEIPKCYRGIISEIRQYLNTKTTFEEIIEWLETHDDRMPRTGIFKNGRLLRVEEMTEEERDEINLYYRWIKSKEKKLVDRYAGKDIEKVPQKHRKIVELARYYGIRKTTYEAMIEWLEIYNGKFPREYIYRHGKKVEKSELTDEEIEETRLYKDWYVSKERKLMKATEGMTIEEIRAEGKTSEDDIEKIMRLRELMQDRKNKDKKIENRMRQAVRKQVENNSTIREELSREDVLLKDNNQEEGNR